jgi:Glyoxalase/Bleomycin resistance protein/Dioxygenase superfamily
MQKNEGLLKAPVSIKESQLPSHITPMSKPQAMGRAVELAFLRWEKRCLDQTEIFLYDFGFQGISRTQSRLIARGTGPSPAIFVANQGAKNRFIGLAFVMSEDTDLDTYVRNMGAKQIDASLIPGGGRGVELDDPGGRIVWLLQGQVNLPELPNRESVTNLINSPNHKPRINRAMRTPIEPAKIIRIGHIVVQAVDFTATTQWYMRVLGLIPTDVQYLGDGSPNLAFCRLNLGSAPADHHSMVFAGGIEDKYEHSAYEVIDLDAVGQGQQVLRAGGYKHLWGIGRHFFGSQFFDYWYDPDGFEFEHYADGDLFTSDIETSYSPLEFNTIWAWGADMPRAMKPPQNLHALMMIIKRLRNGEITLQKLKLIGKVIAGRGRPWLK